MEPKRGGKRQGSGRKPLFEKSSIVAVRVDDDVIQKIPGVVAVFIREAINEKMEREQHEK